MRTRPSCVTLRPCTHTAAQGLGLVPLLSTRLPYLPRLHHLQESAQTHVHWVSDTIQPSHPPSSPSPFAFHFSSIRVFSNELALHIRWPKYWSFSFRISPSSEYSGLIFFRIDWSDLLVVQRTPKGLLQPSWKELSSAFFLVQLSHPYMTPGKTIALTILTFVSKVMALLFNMLSMLVITFLPRGIFNFRATVTVCSDFGAQENTICHCFHFFPIYLPWSDGTWFHDLSFLNAEF